jgi:hypothetical protein
LSAIPRIGKIYVWAGRTDWNINALVGCIELAGTGQNLLMPNGSKV